MQDFKAQIHLLVGNTDEALSLLEFGSNPLGHIVAELIRMDEAECEWEEYEQGLFDIYGKTTVEKALAILEGEELLIDVTLHGDYHNMLVMYDKLEVKKAVLIHKK